MSNGHSNANALLVAIDNSEACLKAIEFCQKNFPSGKEATRPCKLSAVSCRLAALRLLSLHRDP